VQQVRETLCVPVADLSCSAERREAVHIHKPPPQQGIPPPHPTHPHPTPKVTHIVCCTQKAMHCHPTPDGHISAQCAQTSHPEQSLGHAACCSAAHTWQLLHHVPLGPAGTCGPPPKMPYPQGLQDPKRHLSNANEDPTAVHTCVMYTPQKKQHCWRNSTYNARHQPTRHHCCTHGNAQSWLTSNSLSHNLQHVVQRFQTYTLEKGVRVLQNCSRLWPTDSFAIPE
jgi:hypothetical protein